MKTIAIVTGYSSKIGGVEIFNGILESVLSEFYKFIIISSEDILQSTSISFKDKLLYGIIGGPYLTQKYFRKMGDIFDFVICNGEYSFGIRHKSAICVFHGNAFGYRKALTSKLKFTSKLSLIRFEILQKLGAMNKSVISVSNRNAKDLQKNGIKVDKVITNAVNTNIFIPMNIRKEFDLIIIGSYAYKGYAKGFDIVKQISEKRSYNILAVTNSKPDFICQHEYYIDNSNLVEIYNKCKILILPSRFEGCPLVILEALSCGIPVITSNTGISDELKTYAKEFVSMNNTADEYIYNIEQIIKNYIYFSELARLVAIKEFGYGKFSKSWLDFIEYEMSK